MAGTGTMLPRRRQLARIAALLAWAAGLSLFVGLVVREGIGDVAVTVTAAGWGVAAVAAFHLAPLIADAEAWRLLVARGTRPGHVSAVRNRWIGEAVNALLPAANVGGEFVRVRIAMLDGLPGRIAGASVLADMAVGVVTQLLFALLGLLALVHTGAFARNGLGETLLAGVAVLAPAVLAFLVAQRHGLFRRVTALVVRIAGHERWAGAIGGAAALETEIDGIYGRRRALALALLWRFLGWTVAAGEIWVGFRVLGVDIDWIDAFMMESLVQSARTAAFFIPAGLGVQEGALVLLGGIVGIDPGTCIALSLLKRSRDLVLGLPGLATWYALEGRRILGRSPAE